MFGTRQSIDLYSRVTLVSVPETLLPYFVETVKTVRISGSAGGNPILASQMDRRTTRIHWKP